MIDFETRIAAAGEHGLYSTGIEILQANVGLRCNQACAHCHLNASPNRAEMMTPDIMDLVLRAARAFRCGLVDITGGAPELHPRLRDFIRDLRAAGLPVQLRTNLSVLTEPAMEDMPLFLRRHQVHLVGSMPCYLEENVRAQRGPGVYEKSIVAIRKLNALGYGVDAELPLNLVYNPAGPFLPPEQSALEAAYRRELATRFGVRFTRLLAIANMPIGRFLADLRRRRLEQDYLGLLFDSFNPATVAGLMCRHQISVAWDGTLYDCDFNLALGWPVDHGIADHVRDFDPETLAHRRIVTGPHCFGCTAGAGSSCRGTLA